MKCGIYLNPDEVAKKQLEAVLVRAANGGDEGAVYALRLLDVADKMHQQLKDLVYDVGINAETYDEEFAEALRVGGTFE
jgi:hypothetical protein